MEYKYKIEICSEDGEVQHTKFDILTEDIALKHLKILKEWYPIVNLYKQEWVQQFIVN